MKRLRTILVMVASAILVGCGTTDKKQEQDDYFTSGSREADQRASQRMAKAEQLEDSGGKDESGGEKGPGAAEDKLPLYERLGGEQGIARIVDDFTTRALQDPRVNWQREGVKKGGFLFGRNDSVTWNASPENVARLKKHMAQFFALATGGPAKYEGKNMASAHAGLRITNAEFDSAVGDLKASLDRLKIPNQEQKELLAIVESTRPQVVTER